MRYMIIVAVMVMAVSTAAADGPVAADDQVAALEARIVALEAMVVDLESRLTTQEVLLRLRTAELTKRTEQLQATYSKTLGGVAEVLGTTEGQVGVQVSERVAAALAVLNSTESTRNAQYDAMVEITAAKAEGIGAVPTLASVLADSQDRYLRRLAADALGAVSAGSVGQPARDAVRALRAAATNDEDDIVRSHAMGALKKVLR